MSTKKQRKSTKTEWATPSRTKVQRKLLAETYRRLPRVQIKKGASIVTLMLIGGVVLFAAGNFIYVQLHARQQAKRLDAVAADLKAAQDELLKTLPNVKEHSFEKSCGQANIKGGNGPIWCGPVAYFLLDGVSEVGISSNDDLVEKTLSDKGFLLDNDDIVQRARDRGVAKMARSGITCEMYADYFQTNQVYIYQSNRINKNYQDGIYKLVIYCDEHSDIRLPGYSWR